MHMADALLSPAVGGTMWVASAAVVVSSARQIRKQADDRLVPLMGVCGAFVFAAQMVNFGIPGTGSSGHVGGGLLLASLLGPQAAFLVMASILTLQALLFADGGLLALGCNLFNLGVFPCFIAYPLVFRPILGTAASAGRLWAACLLAAVVGLELGAFSVVLQTTLSGRTELPFAAFLVLMLPTHLAISVVEGLATASVLGFVRKARPEVLPAADERVQSVATRRVAWGLLVASLLVGGVASWFASARPDGLEWAIAQTAGRAEIERSSSVHDGLARIQQRTAWLPDYGFPEDPQANAAPRDEPWPNVRLGLSVSGLLGSLMLLFIAGAIGFALRCADFSPVKP